MSDWISVEERLPEKRHFPGYLAWIKTETKLGGYWDIVSYSDYICDIEDLPADDPHYTEDDYEGNYKGTGWHREEETHGGIYDSIFIDLNDKVTHWMPLPTPPSVTQKEERP
jgi:hypothetical protein